MKIQFNESCAGKNFVAAKGEIKDLPQAVAKKYIGFGLAIAYDQEPDTLEESRPLKPIVQEVKKTRKRPQKRNVKPGNSKNK